MPKKKRPECATPLCPECARLRRVRERMKRPPVINVARVRRLAEKILAKRIAFAVCSGLMERRYRWATKLPEYRLAVRIANKRWKKDGPALKAAIASMRDGLRIDDAEIDYMRSLMKL